MTKQQLARLGLEDTATPEQINTRLEELASAEERMAAVPVQLGRGVECPPDIDQEDCIWRIKAGLLPHQAVQAARFQKIEDDRTGASRK